MGATLGLVAGRALICDLTEKPRLGVQKEACAGMSVYQEILGHPECQQQETEILRGH